jgi:hypothetical protein
MACDLFRLYFLPGHLPDDHDGACPSLAGARAAGRRGASRLRLGRSAARPAGCASFDPLFIGLTGTSAQISAAAKSFNVFYERHDSEDRNYTYDHSSYVYLVDPGGTLAEALSSDRGSQQIAAALLALMRKAP